MSGTRLAFNLFVQILGSCLCKTVQWGNHREPDRVHSAASEQIYQITQVNEKRPKVINRVNEQRAAGDRGGEGAAFDTWSQLTFGFLNYSCDPRHVAYSRHQLYLTVGPAEARGLAGWTPTKAGAYQEI